MTKKEIQKLYLSLSSDFTVKPFDEVLEQCHKIVKKYFSCFPLLFQIDALFVNISMEAENMDKALKIL